MNYSFTVPGEPVPQGRPRFARMGKFVRVYDPADSSDFKGKVAFSAKRAGVKVLSNPVAVKAVFFVKRPKKLMRKKDPEGIIICSVRPDGDNYFKAVLDALNEIAYKDDGQVFDGRFKKFYHEKNGVPRTEITIEER